MSQCVPSWDLDDETTATPLSHRRSLRSHSVSTADVPLLDYEVAELTWENGQVAMHAFGPPRLLAKPSLSTAKYAGWDKPRACGTLESIVNQATSTLPLPNKPPFDASDTVGGGGDELVTWFHDHHRAAMKRVVATASTTGTMDALVPTPVRDQSDHHLVAEAVPVPGVIASTGAIVVPGCSTRVESCSGATGAATNDDSTFVSSKHGSLARVPDWSSRSQSVNNSATFGLTVDSTKTSDHDSVCHSRPQRKAGDEEDRKKRSTGKSSQSTKRSRAAAIHNQSERKRRDKINQKMKTLQKMVPNSSKTDKASMLDEVIDYLKNLQAQIQMMSRMNMPAMMLPMAMQQQLQMAMMAATPSNTGMGMGMGIGMGMGMGMDMNAMGRPNVPGISSILPPTPLMPMASWDFSGGDRLRGPSTAVMPDPLSAFLACQSQQQQPMTMDAYSMMAAMYQQFHQPPSSSSKS